MIRAKRIFDRAPDGSLRSLYHGTKGSRTLARGVWHRANQRWVHDGSGQTNRRYRGGYHVFLTDEGLETYLRRFTVPRDLVICEVLVRDVRPKPTNPNVLLAKWMLIPEDAVPVGCGPRQQMKEARLP